jgi:hypothetical protein
MYVHERTEFLASGLAGGQAGRTDSKPAPNDDFQELEIP